MRLCNDVLVRPASISFAASPIGAHSPVEVLIANKSDVVLRFKILCTARSKYSLSKSKAVLRPNDFIKISIELTPSLDDHNRRDFFKIQFFDCNTNAPLGDRYISSTVWSNSTEGPYHQLDSDSCSSWPSQSERTLSGSPSRTASLARALDGHSMQKRNLGPRINTINPSHTPSGLRVEPLPALPYSQRLTPASRRCSRPSSSFLYRLAYFIAFMICFVGICLPLIPTQFLSRWYQHSATTTTLRPQTLTCAVGSTYLHHTCPASGSAEEIVSTTHHRPSHSSYTNEYGGRSANRLTTTYLLYAVQNLYNALCTIDPVSVVADVSWFCLGLLVMYVLMVRSRE